MADITGASLGPIYERLNSAPTYHPLEADTFADWSLEAGDIVTVTRDSNGYQSPVHSSVMTWKKQPQMQLSSTGSEQREAISKMSQKKFRSGSSSLRANNYQHIYVDDAYGRMRSGLELTGSSAALYVNDRYKQMKSGLDLTSSSAALYVDNKYAQMKSGLNLTSSSAALYVDNKYAQMKSGLQLTSSSAALYTLDSYNQMRAGLSMSTSHVSLYVDNRYNQMKAGLSLTSSSAALYVNDRYNQMKSGLDLTSSSAALYVDNKYAQMKSGLELTESSSMLYARSRTTRAFIMTRINADGEGEALIEADKVSITGRTTINDVMSISDNRVYIKTPARINGDVLAGSLTLRDGGSSDTLNAADLPGVIKSASVSGNVLTLIPIHGDPITFSKATTLVGVWSGSGNLVVTASPQNEKYDITLVDSGSWTNDVWNGKIKYYYGSDDEHQYETGLTYSVSRASTLSGIWSSGNLKVSASPQTKTDKYDITLVPEDGKVKYYYGSDDEHKYETGATYSTSGTPTNLGIYDSNSNLVTGKTLSIGETFPVWAGYKIGDDWTWGSQVDIVAPSDPHPTAYALYCTEGGQVPGTSTFRYKFTMEYSSAKSFSAGNTYNFYR